MSEAEAASELIDLIKEKLLGAKILLIPQYAPKFHPSFDKVLHGLLKQIPQLLVVMPLPEKKQVWRNTLINRWKRSIGGRYIQRVVWLPPLTPEQLMLLMAIGDVSLDTYPFGGGVTTLESLAVCTPVVTLAEKQTVPALTAGMLRYTFGSVSGDPAQDAGAEAEYRGLVHRWLLPRSPRSLVDGMLVLFNKFKALNETTPYEAEAEAEAKAKAKAGGEATVGKGGIFNTETESAAERRSPLLPRLRAALCRRDRIGRLFNDSSSADEWGRMLGRLARR